MAFTGVPVVKLVSDTLVRITGVSLLAAASGTIGLAAHLTAGINLPAAFQPAPYDLPDAGGPVTLQDSVEASFNYVEATLNDTPVSIAKSGTTPADFLITITNNDPGEGEATGDLEIYVRFH